MYELIITEKPSSAKKIVAALADSKPIIEKNKGVSIFKFTHNKKDVVVVSAVGHLYSLTEKEKSFKYPSYDIEWKPAGDVDKNAAFSKKYLTVIKKLSKDANSFTVACDYDVEGEVIGLNIIRYACKQKDASRMKYSTLTKEDLVESYNKKQPSIDWGQALAGETRHYLDWLYGINLSRALTLAIKKAGRFKIMSSGRVQGPALKILVDKEKEIRAFKPVSYWQITMKGEKNKKVIETLHETEKFWEEKEAKEKFGKIKGEKKASVESISKKKFKQQPPNPFDLGALQTESYKLFGIQPKQTLQIAQTLYMEGVTSYPRTSSQQLPKELGYVKLLTALTNNPIYTEKAKKVLAMKNVLPNNGKKKDPAHPAIYPTGLIPKKLEGRDAKVYDLIVKRFLATFGEAAERETVTAKFDVKGEKFIGKGTLTLFKGWHELYEPYVKLKEEEMPQLTKGEEIKVKKIEYLSKETQPPKRYTPASIISELEKRGLGTKATRADIVENLFTRGYVHEKSIQATELGIKVESTLEKYVPEIIDEELTRKFEDEMEEIRERKKTQDQILDKAKEHLTKLLTHFKDNEKKIGDELVEANQETQDRQNTLGPCPTCKKGTIMIKRGRFGMFAACDKYPDCKATFNLPKMAMIKPTDKISPKGYPIILAIRKGKKPQELSLNPEENSDLSSENQKMISEIKSGKIVKKCEKCGGKMRVMSSIFGEFLGCSNYPKCKNTVSFEPEKKPEESSKEEKKKTDNKEKK